MTAFYVSPDGSNANVGTAEDAPWQTISHINAQLASGAIKPGDNVLFERGREFFGVIIPLATYPQLGEYVTFGHYGKTAQNRRPKISAYKVLNTAGGWTLHAAGVYKIDLTNPATHTGNSASWIPSTGHLLVDGAIYGARKWAVGDLAQAWDFYCDATYLYVKASANPTTLAADIRAAPDQSTALLQPSTKYVGLELVGAGRHGLNGWAKHSRAYDLWIHHIGGSENLGQVTTVDGVDYPQRFGNGIEASIGSSDVIAEGNYIGDCYDVAMTMQGALNSGAGRIAFDKLIFRRNVDYRCTQSAEFWHSGTPEAGSGMVACAHEDNVSLYAGYSWGYPVRPDKDVAAALLTYSWDLPADLAVRRNVFYAPRAYRWSNPSEGDAGMVCGENVVLLQAGAKLEFHDAQTIEQAAAWVAARNNDHGSQFFVLPPTTPSNVATALEQLAADAGGLLGRTERGEDAFRAARGDAELARETGRTPSSLRVQTYTTDGSSAIGMRRKGEAAERFSVTDAGDMWLGDGTGAVDTYVKRAAANRVDTNAEVKSFKAAVGTAFSHGLSTESFVRFSVLSQGAAGSARATAIYFGGGSAGVDANICWMSTGRLQTDQQFRAADGIGTKDLGDITGKTSDQIDALFTAGTTPSDGWIATALLSGNPVHLLRRGGKWNVSAAYTQIA